MKTTGLLSLLLLGIIFVHASFRPQMRFADPAPEELLESKRNYPCYHDRIYLGISRADALYFGASKTHFGMNADLAENAYEAVNGEKLDIFAFDTPLTNPELSYFFFRDYLANNPGPRAALFSLTWIGPRPEPVRYIHPLFANLAPPYLYKDVISSWDLVEHKLFAVSDFIRLIIRHLDLSLSRLMVANYRFVVPDGDNCHIDTSVSAPVGPGFNQANSFEELLDAEIERVLPDVDPAEVGQLSGLVKTYANQPSLANRIKSLSNTSGQRDNRHFWMRGAATETSLYYYRRIVELGREHNVKIGFYYLPNILAREPGIDEIEQVINLLDAPVYTIPYRYIKVSYHHYRDPAHVTPEFTPFYSAWLASLIDRIEED